MRQWLFAAAFGAALVSGCKDSGTTFTFDAAADGSASDGGAKSDGGDAGGGDKPATTSVDAPIDGGGD
jgi:hypothetical protein